MKFTSEPSSIIKLDLIKVTRREGGDDCCLAIDNETDDIGYEGGLVPGIY